MPFSTFTLGIITASVHGTRMHAKEIKKNVALFRFATTDIERNDFNQQLKFYYKGANAFKKQQCSTMFQGNSYDSTYFSLCAQMNQSETLNIQQHLTSKHSHTFYKVLFAGKVRFCVSTGKTVDDGCVAYQNGNGTLEAGFIRAIAQKNSSDAEAEAVIYVEKFILQRCLSVNIEVDNRPVPLNITCSDFAFIKSSGHIVPIHPSNLIEKLSYIQIDTTDFIVIRYPNLLESS